MTKDLDLEFKSFKSVSILTFVWNNSKSALLYLNPIDVFCDVSPVNVIDKMQVCKGITNIFFRMHTMEEHSML